MAPNPATSDVTISVSDATPVRSWTVFDISGRMVRSNAQANTTSFVLRRDNLQNGMYLVKMQFDKGTLTKKLIFE
jgi:formylmethanofuran dehydrogenase subunit E-like metal-binding protein